MSLLDHAITTYRAAAAMLDRVAKTRVDLLASAAASVRDASLIEGHRDLGPDFDICLPAGSRANLAFRRPRTDGIDLETDAPAWMTLEGRLPDTAAAATVCFAEVGIDCREPVAADIFLRVIDPDGTYHDQPPQEMLIAGGLAVTQLDLPQDAAAGAYRKVILHLRRPQMQLSLRQFALIPL
ncbi:hypothetical protein GI374_13270 [Paracoccus sp. S-4012]|uniref:hypothetical protein n=1 Tax=Paracoccus sp. S-4012 TaxID=2665648 RepID=UPI0012B00C91|nr:hypothetical protein [Paracoccus sp. S-4012]MRX51394.1 hypothetical protein [Paracoccus sp. S-4012]